MSEQAQLTSCRVLVVDDHDLQRRVLVRLIENEGVRAVHEASDGEGALEILQNGEIDVVLCDLDMPGVDGLGVVRALVDERSPVAFALLSAVEPVILDCVELMTESKPIRFLGAIEKPVSVVRLRALLLESTVELSRRERPEPRALSEIKEALVGDQLVPYFQPIVDARTGALRGVEALARWEHPGDGTLSPAVFLPTLEEYDGTNALTWVILEKTLAFIKRTESAGLHIPVSVNLSAGFLGRNGVAGAISAKLSGAGVPPARISFEVTEGVALTTVVDALENLARLRMRGHRLIIDDFGTEYASLRQLVRVPFQVMKLDHHFVREAMSHVRAFGVLRSAVAMARELTMETVIEGVETNAERERLASVDCDMHQGFHYGRAIPADELIDRARANLPQRP